MSVLMSSPLRRRSLSATSIGAGAASKRGRSRSHTVGSADLVPVGADPHGANDQAICRGEDGIYLATSALAEPRTQPLREFSDIRSPLNAPKPHWLGSELIVLRRNRSHSADADDRRQAFKHVQVTGAHLDAYHIRAARLGGPHHERPLSFEQASDPRDLKVAHRQDGGGSTYAAHLSTVSIPRAKA